MKADYLSYQHAAYRSLLGLAVHVILGLALLIYAVLVRDTPAGVPVDHAAMTAALFMLAGVPVWLMLAIVFDQHRRERIEAVEAEAFAAEPVASVFEQAGEDLRVAARRLKLLYRFVMPAVSAALAVLLLTLGVWRLRSGSAAMGAFAAPEAYRGWAIALGLGCAFVGFLLARYLSGMAQQPMWVNLRAGAAYAAGTALLGLGLAVGHLVDIPGPDLVLKYLLVVYPGVLVAVGGEMALNVVLDLYRPRKPGEFPRPGFESRVLGFLAAPDRIAESIGEALSYQFGYDVTDTWVYRLLARSFLRVLVPAAVAVLWSMSTLVVVRPHERGMVLRFGRLDRIIEPGLHLKWPWPIETVEVPPYFRRDPAGKIEGMSRTVTGVRTLQLGSPPPAADKPILWTNEHAQETFFIVQPDPATRPGRDEAEPAEGRMHFAVLAAEIPVQYAIADLEAYEQLSPPEMRDDLLRAVAQRAVMQRLSRATLGDLLSGRRLEIQRQLRQAVEQAFVQINPLGNGQPVAQVLFVGIAGIHPPRETARAFEAVIEVHQKYLARLHRAQGQRIETLTRAVGSVELAEHIIAELDALEALARGGADADALAGQRLKIVSLIRRAGGQAASVIFEASADRWSRHLGERARLAQYLGQVETFRAAPTIYRVSLYLDALRSAVAQSRVVVTDGEVPIDVRLDVQDRETVSDIFQSQQPLDNPR